MQPVSRRRSWGPISGLGVLVLALLRAPAAVAAAGPGESLPEGAAQAADPDFEVVALSPAVVASRLTEPGLAVVDLRSDEEFAVSHIPGSVHIGPGMTTAAFLAGEAGRTLGAAYVFVCVVGMRSRDFADGLVDEMIAAGAREVAILEGGLIAWHNAGLPLIDARGPTPYLHPMEARFVPLIRQPELVRFAPASP